jgi:hypothetical protein
VPEIPRNAVVIDHIARIKADSKNRDEEVKELCNLARHKLTTVKISAFYALSKGQPLSWICARDSAFVGSLRSGTTDVGYRLPVSSSKRTYLP